jgi:regulator of replication initiation timing
MSDLKTKFNELIEKQRALALEFQTTAQSLFKETTKEFFEQNPGVKSIT